MRLDEQGSSRIAVRTTVVPLPKSPTGNPRLDRILAGGLPRGRATLFSGGPGRGKSLIAPSRALTLGWDIAALEREKRLLLLDAPIRVLSVIQARNGSNS